MTCGMGDIYFTPRNPVHDWSEPQHLGCAPAGPNTASDVMGPSYCSWAIESGVQASYLAVVMGTSIRELEDTYFRWLRRADDQLRAVFDAYDLAAAN